MGLAQSQELIRYLWLVICVVWVVSALFAKRATRVQSRSSSIYHRALSILAFIVGFTPYTHFGALTWRFIPFAPLAAEAGLALALTGAALAIWARLSLGGNWSATVTIKANHTLVRRGPYALVRHPIYSGLLLSLLGTAMVYDEVRCLLAVVLVVIMLASKIGMEESFMTEQFGSEYVDYKRRVKALIPLVW